MAHIARKVTVAAPVREVYDTWMRFDELAETLPSVKRVERLDDTHLRWHVAIAGRDTSFDAEIVEQVPGSRVAWRSTQGPAHAGAVDFRGLSDAATEVEVTMDVPADELSLPDEVVEKRLGASIAKNLRRFKRRVEVGETRRSGAARALRGIELGAAGASAVFALGWGARGLLEHEDGRPWRRRRRPPWRERVPAAVVALSGALAAVAVALRAVRGR